MFPYPPPRHGGGPWQGPPKQPTDPRFIGPPVSGGGPGPSFGGGLGGNYGATDAFRRLQGVLSLFGGIPGTDQKPWFQPPGWSGAGIPKPWFQPPNFMPLVQPPKPWIGPPVHPPPPGPRPY